MNSVNLHGPSPFSQGCEAPAPPLLLRGIAEFNQGEYYQCHETLEHLWLQEASPAREFYQGIIQIGVGLHHLQRGNYRGACRLLERGLARLKPFSPACRQVDVARLLVATAQCLAAARALGPEGLQRLDRALIPCVGLVSPAS